MNKKQIHEAIKDYPWMIKLLMTKREQSSKGLVAQYGIESVMPKAQGGTTDPIYQEMLRIEKYDENIKGIRHKVMFVQRYSQFVTNIRNRMILDLLLDGLPFREVALELDMSISGVKHRKDDIVEQMAQKAKLEQKEKPEKISSK